MGEFISNYGLFAVLKCLLSGFGIFRIEVTISGKMLTEFLFYKNFYLYKY